MSQPTVPPGGSAQELVGVEGWEGGIAQEFKSVFFSLLSYPAGIGIHYFHPNPQGGRPQETREEEGGAVTRLI